MKQEQGVAVRWRTKGDVHADSITRGRWLGTRGQRHLHWAAPPERGEADGTLVVEIDGAVVGRLLVEATYPPFGELQNMNVARPWRGRGAGGALVDECIRQLGRRGFMAVFCQTHFTNPTGHRLYARKGFLPVARGEMLRLLRFISYPLLEEFLCDHPLAVYRPADAEAGRQWPMTWSDWATGHQLTIALTGGSSDKDSDSIGPGISDVEILSGPLSFAANLAAPAQASRGKTIGLQLGLVNRGEKPLAASVRLLLPPGFQPRGDRPSHGQAMKIEPGEKAQAEFEVALAEDLELVDHRWVSWTSLPLTVEVFAGGTSCWLTHSLMIESDSAAAVEDK